MLADHKQIDIKKYEEPKQKCRLGTANNEITEGHQLVCDRPILALCFVLVPQTRNCSVCVEES